MRIQIKSAMKALGYDRPHQLAQYVGASRTAGYYWEERRFKYLPEIWAYKLIDKNADMRRLIE